MWDDDGPGWDAHPEVKAVCKPVLADDGLFWLEKSEFFKYFQTIYLCAMDMSEFIEGEPIPGGRLSFRQKVTATAARLVCESKECQSFEAWAA